MFTQALTPLKVGTLGIIGFLLGLIGVSAHHEILGSVTVDGTGHIANADNLMCPDTERNSEIFFLSCGGIF